MGKLSASELREQAKKLLQQAKEIEKVEIEKAILKAGELCKNYFNDGFKSFNHDSFVTEVKGIFGNNDKPIKHLTERAENVKLHNHVVDNTPPGILEKSQEETQAENKKRGWF